VKSPLLFRTQLSVPYLSDLENRSWEVLCLHICLGKYLDPDLLSNFIDHTQVNMGQYARNTEFLSPHNKRSLSLENSKLDFRPEITPSDPEWIKWRTIFLTSLRNKSVQDVLSTHFTSAEQSYILPHPLQDDTLRIQTEDGQLYKTLLKPGHRFQNVPDNLATKLTMLHFGLPVQPATLNNIFGSGKAEDMSDETDEENEVPRVRKFLYSERPLEFLERYEKRSYGHPSLRSELF